MTLEVSAIAVALGFISILESNAVLFSPTPLILAWTYYSKKGTAHTPTPASKQKLVRSEAIPMTSYGVTYRDRVCWRVEARFKSY